jgi:hypothetical protein
VATAIEETSENRESAFIVGSKVKYASNEWVRNSGT